MIWLILAGFVLLVGSLFWAACRQSRRDDEANARRQAPAAPPWGYAADWDAPRVPAGAEEIGERATSFTEAQAAYFGAPAGSVQVAIQPNAQGHNTAIMDPASGRAYATFYASEW